MSRRAWMLFAAVSVLWGIPYVFIKIAVEELSPAQVAFGRLAVGFVVLLPFALRRRGFVGVRRRWRPLLAYTVIELVVAWPLIGFGEQRISASLTGVLLAAVPLILAVILARLDPDERPSGLRAAGLVLGFVGVVTLLGMDIGGASNDLLGALAVLGAAVCYAIAPLIVNRRLADVDQVGTVAASFGLAALILAPASLWRVPSHVPTAGVVASVGVLGVVCSALAFLCFFALIAEAGPQRASIITYVLPLVAVAFAVVALGEKVHPSMALGMALILIGSWLATTGGVRRRRTPVAETLP